MGRISKLKPIVKIALIVCITLLLALIIVGMFRALALGIITWDNLIEAIKLFMNGNEKAMIGVM